MKVYIVYDINRMTVEGSVLWVFDSYEEARKEVDLERVIGNRELDIIEREVRRF